MRVGIFVDTTNLYRTVYRKYRGKLCYKEYFQQVVGEDEVVIAIAYGMQIGHTHSFENCLTMAGYTPKFKNPRIIEIQDVKIKKCDWGIGLTMDIVENIDSFDIVIIGSSDYNLLPLIQWLKAKGKEVRIVASLIPRALKEIAECTEIPEDWLELEDEE